MLSFTLDGSCAELGAPAGATIAVDPEQRELIRGAAYAFRDPDGDHFLAKITSVKQAQRGMIERAGCEVIGRVVGWSSTERPVLH
jgi:hypothetical protein